MLRDIVRRHRFARWALMASLVAILAPITAHAQSANASKDKSEAILSSQPDDGQKIIKEWHLRDSDLVSALRQLAMWNQQNVVLSPKVDGSQRVEASVYNVTIEQVLDSLLTPLGLAYQRQGNFIYVYTRKELDEMARAQRTVSSAVYKLHYITAADAAVMIKPLLSPIGQVAATAQAQAGIESGASGTGGNSYSTNDALIITDFPENLELVSKVLRDLDVRPRQVLIEATILRATLTEDNALGIDFNTLGGIDFASLTASAGGDGEGESSGATGYPSNAAALDGTMAGSKLNSTTFNIKTDFLDPAIFPRGGFSFGIIKNNIAAFIRALEEVTDTTVVANPKVLALNKQKGEVIVGRRDGYLTTVTTETETVQKVEFLETGVQLVFRPYIGEDGYVRMELHPEDSSGALTAANLPFEETTEVTTNLLVKDGHTVVIGGLFREQTRASRAQVPILGNIPYAGTLFRRRADKTVREEVIILLTVHIIEDNEQYAKAGEQALEDVERIRVGLRQSLMCSGRNRLAQAHYKWALEHLQQGDVDKALWDLNMATHLEPRFYAAITKKEELTGQRAWEANTAVTRNFIYNRLLGAENEWIDAMGQPPASPLRPAPDARSDEWGEPVRTFPATQPDGVRE